MGAYVIRASCSGLFKRERATRRKMRQPELALQKAVREFLNVALPRSVFWTATPGGGNRDARTGAMLKASGVKAGLPDLLFVFEGLAIFIELKAAKGKLSDTQKITFPLLLEAGAPVHVCRSVAEVAADLTECGIPLRAKSGDWIARKVSLRSAA